MTWVRLLMGGVACWCGPGGGGLMTVLTLIAVRQTCRWRSRWRWRRAITRMG
jgi:hypothetical protein